jgi:hypothetical protein
MIFVVNTDCDSAATLVSHEGRVFRIQELNEGKWEAPSDVQEICEDIADASQGKCRYCSFPGDG